MKQSMVKEYFRPTELAEAVKTYADYPGLIWPLAGATDIFTANHLEVEALLDVSKLGLSYVCEAEGGLVIGAATTFSEIIRAEPVQKRFPALWQAAKHLADMTTRNLATIGGNICTALPSGDSLPPLFVMDCRFVIATPQGEQTVAVGDFFTGPRQTVMQKGYILKEIIMPPVTGRQSSAFEKMGRNSEDLAVVNAAVWLRLDDEDAIAQIRIAHGAVAPTVVRSLELEAALVGQKPDEALLDEYCLLVDRAIAPITNIRGTAEYRRDCSRVLTKRAILKAYAAAKGAN